MNEFEPTKNKPSKATYNIIMQTSTQTNSKTKHAEQHQNKNSTSTPTNNKTKQSKRIKHTKQTTTQLTKQCTKHTNIKTRKQTSTQNKKASSQTPQQRQQTK